MGRSSNSGQDEYWCDTVHIALLAIDHHISPTIKSEGRMTTAPHEVILLDVYSVSEGMLVSV